METVNDLIAKFYLTHSELGSLVRAMVAEIEGRGQAIQGKDQEVQRLTKELADLKTPQ